MDDFEALSPEMLAAAAEPAAGGAIGELPGGPAEVDDAGLGLETSIREMLDSVEKGNAEESRQRTAELADMHIDERTNTLKQDRALEKWNKFSSEWQRFENRMVHQLGKQPEELVMNRMDAFNEKLQAAEQQ